MYEYLSIYQFISLKSVSTNLPVRGLGIGQRLTSQPEVTLLKSKAGQELWSLGLEFVEVALFDCDRWHKHCPLWKLGRCGRETNCYLVFLPGAAEMNAAVLTWVLAAAALSTALTNI